MPIPSRATRAQTFRDEMIGARTMMDAVSSGSRSVVSAIEAGGTMAYLYYTYKALRKTEWDHQPTPQDQSTGWLDYVEFALSPSLFVGWQIARASGGDTAGVKQTLKEMIGAIVTRDMWIPEVRRTPGEWKAWVNKDTGRTVFRREMGKEYVAWVLDIPTCILLALLSYWVLTATIQVTKGLMGGVMAAIPK